MTKLLKTFLCYLISTENHVKKKFPKTFIDLEIISIV